MRSSRDVRIFRRGAPAVAAGPSLVDQILAFGPAQWLRFTSDNVTLNVGNISGATDLSGNARHASQGTAAQQPAFANPGANGDGVNDVLASAGGAFLNGITSGSLFIVADLTGEALSISNQVYGLDLSNFHFDFGGVGGAPRMSIQPGGAGAIIAPEGPTGRSAAAGRFLFDARLVNGACRMWDNGVPGVDVTTAWAFVTLACVSAPFTCAGRADGFRPFPGVVQDVIVFTNANTPSLANQAVLRGLLAQLEGVTL
jgi:hypothetical protein